jgi:hypothetical protein
MAARVPSKKRIANQLSNRFCGVAGSHENEKALLATPNMLTIGVKNPRRSDTPPMIARELIINVHGVGLSWPSRQTTPLITDVTPRAARNSSNPIPALPSGKVKEKNRSSGRLPVLCGCSRKAIKN